MAKHEPKTEFVLDIPKPRTIVPAGFAGIMREQAQQIDSLEILDDGRRRLAALEKYVKDKKQQIEVQAAARWCEVRIGELLPRAEDEVGGRGNKASQSCEGLGSDERYRFRILSGAIPIVEECIRQNIVARDRILTAIERARIKKVGAAVELAAKANIYHADIRTWKAPRQYDWIITDPPYPKEYLELYGVLAERAQEWLKPGGMLVVMCGQSYLDEIYDLLSSHLDYYWTGAYLLPGQPTPLRQVNVNCSWKPLLFYCRKDAKYAGKIFGDVFRSDANDKDFHKWGQSISGMTDIVSRLCLPGEYLLDPFCGGGTTGIAAIAHGCFFDGVEIEADNVNISKARINGGLNG